MKRRALMMTPPSKPKKRPKLENCDTTNNPTPTPFECATLNNGPIPFYMDDILSIIFSEISLSSFLALKLVSKHFCGIVNLISENILEKTNLLKGEQDLEKKRNIQETITKSQKYLSQTNLTSEDITSRHKILKDVVANNYKSLFLWMTKTFNFRHSFKILRNSKSNFVEFPVYNEDFYEYGIIPKENSVNQIVIAYSTDGNFLEWYQKDNLVSSDFIDPVEVSLLYGNTVSLDWLKAQRKFETTPLHTKHRIGNIRNQIADYYKGYAICNIKSLNWLLQNKIIDQSDILNCNFISLALKRGKIETAEWLELYYGRENIPWAKYEEMLYSCLENGYYPGILWALKRCTNPQPFINYMLHIAGLNKNYDLLNFIMEHNLIDKHNQLLKKPDFYGDEKLFPCLIKHGIEIISSIHLYAINTENSTYIALVFELVPIKTIHQHEKLGLKIWKTHINNSKKYMGKSNEPLRICDHLIVHQVYMDRTVAICAAKSGSIELLDILIRNDCPWDEEVIIQAMDYDNDLLAIWAIRNDCPITYEVMMMALFCKKKNVIEELTKKKCPWKKELELFPYPNFTHEKKSSFTLFKLFPRTKPEKLEEFLKSQKL
jgi:hypothetical protein